VTAPAEGEAEPRPPSPPLTLGVLLKRALRLRCPLCGEGKLFIGWFRMHPKCSHCGLKYEREPGYFLGASYVNYGIIVLPVTFLYIVLHFQFRIPNESLRWLIAVCVIVPLITFRYSRAIWLAIDCHFDRSIREEL
jgi:uncharacterized protein (DUF983 family)